MQIVGQDFARGTCRFGYDSGVEMVGRSTREWRGVEVPDWFVLLLVAWPAGVWVIRRVRR